MRNGIFTLKPVIDYPGSSAIHTYIEYNELKVLCCQYYCSEL